MPVRARLSGAIERLIESAVASILGAAL